jgi:hypothetical protein
MLLWIIPLVAFICTWLYWICIESEPLLGLGVAILLTLAVFSLMLVIWGVVICTSDTEWVVDDMTQTHIVSLSDGTNIEGKFYLHRGYIKETLSYYYIIETEYGYKAETAPADKAYIKYTDRQPYVIKYKETISNDFVRWAFGDIDNVSYTFYIPEGSITTDYYNIDLE